MSLQTLVPYLLEYAMLIPAAVYCLIPLWKRLKRRPAVLWRAAGLLAACILAGSFLGAATRFDYAALLVVTAVCFIALRLSTDASTGQVAFCFFNGTMLVYFCVTYTFTLAARWELGNAGDTFTAPTALACLGLSAVVGALFWRTLRVKLPALMAETAIQGIWKALWLLPLGMTVFFWWSEPISAEVVLTGRVQIISLVIFAVILLFVLVLYHLLWSATASVTASARLEQENQLLRAESQRYHELNEYMNQTRTLRHDFRQHLRVITELSRRRQYDQLEEYLGQFEADVGEERTRYCANPAVDAIVAHYAHRAETAGARLEASVSLPERLPVSETDACVLLGNLIENALNAVAALPRDRREIRVMLSLCSQAMIGLSVENPYAGELVLGENGLPGAAQPEHGIGLLSARAIVNRCHGTMQVDTSGGVFRVSVILCG